MPPRLPKNMRLCYVIYVISSSIQGMRYWCIGRTRYSFDDVARYPNGSVCSYVLNNGAGARSYGDGSDHVVRYIKGGGSLVFG